VGNRVNDLFTRVMNALRGTSWWWGLILSLLLIAGSMAVAAVVVVSWPADHFRQGERVPFMNHRHPLVRALALVAKNLIGVVLFLLGVIMVLPGVPGQGILTMLIGVTLVDFPGKRGFERRLIMKPSVLKVINSLRARFHRRDLDFG
jgi:Zn-dependent membrane protease YugP